MRNLPTVALIGRPNVGKSTLFNRLLGQRKSIESEIPGTTRDQVHGEVVWAGKSFELIDLAGIEHGDKSEISESIKAGLEIALEDADLILFLVDWNEKDNEYDKMIARTLRKHNHKTMLVVNKADNTTRQAAITEFQRLGGFDIVPVSAISGMNTGDLLDTIIARLDFSKSEIKKPEENLIHLAIVGRPNVGKSTLLNAIIGQKRAIVSTEAGTTRDIVDVEFDHKGQKIRLIDTAGIRRPGKVGFNTIEKFSVIRALRALRNADVVVVVVDSVEGLTARDLNILGEAKESGRGIVLALNKIDLWKEQSEQEMARQISILQTKINFAPWIPIVFISAKEEVNVKPLLNQVVTAYKNRGTTIPQTDLEEILRYAQENNAQAENFTSLTQKKTNPPTFELKYKGKTEPHESQVRYLENKLRDAYPMNGTPIFIDVSHRR